MSAGFDMSHTTQQTDTTRTRCINVPGSELWAVCVGSMERSSESCFNNYSITISQAYSSNLHKILLCLKQLDCQTRLLFFFCLFCFLIIRIRKNSERIRVYSKGQDPIGLKSKTCQKALTLAERRNTQR